MPGGYIEFEGREINVPDGCDGNHVFWAQAALRRVLHWPQGPGDGTAVETCGGKIPHNIAIHFVNGKPNHITSTPVS